MINTTARLNPGVVLAEDDADLRALLANSIRREGYHVVEASDGGELLQRLEHSREARPSLIVTDVRMPTESGLNVARRVVSWGWNVPIVIITAFSDERTLREAAAAGAEVVMSKPFSLEDFRLVVASLAPLTNQAARRAHSGIRLLFDADDTTRWDPFDALYIDLGGEG